MKVEDIQGSQPRNLTNMRSTEYSNMHYKDVTHDQFKSSRSCNPLNPTYKVRNEDDKVVHIGTIDGNNPRQMPERKNGPRSNSLLTKDIMGAQGSTKGLGVFETHHNRKDFRETNAVGDIPGSQVGTLLKGPKTNRVTNPMFPEYAVPGDKEFAGTTRHALDGIGSNQPPKPPRKRMEPPKPEKPHVTYQKPLDKDRLNEDRNTFYGLEGKHGPEIDVNKLYQAAKNEKQQTGPGVTKEMRNDREFKYHQNKFYAQSVGDQSEMADAKRQFYKDDGQPAVDNPIKRNSQHFKKDQAKFYNESYVPSDTQSQKGSIFKGDANNFYATGGNDKKAKKTVDQKAQHFKRDQAKFFGQTYVPSDKSSEKGSIFQQNAAAFYETAAPKSGERPFKIKQDDCKDKNPVKGKSVLNENRLREHEQNMERDPKFGKNLRRFWGMKSQATVSGAGSFAQKLDKFMD